MSDQESTQEPIQEELQPPAADPAKEPEDTKAIIDGFWVCKLGEGSTKKVCKAETGTQAIQYFAAIVRCQPDQVECEPATFLPVDGCGCGLSKECFDLNKSAVIVEAAFDKLV